MKKTFFSIALLLSGLTSFAQAVKDRNVIPVAVNLNQVLRMTVTNGGNIEFVFNTIEDYKNGLSADALTTGSSNPTSSNSFYKTDFTVSSSTRWSLTYGSEEPTFVGSDNPNPVTPFDLSNVGFKISNLGLNVFEGAGLAKGSTSGASLYSFPTDNSNEVAALEQYPVLLIEDNNQTDANAGDAADNSFTLNWRCGTAEAGAIVPMKDTKIIDQSPSPAPDRYVVNVLFDLAID
jgi:hypothetical protein